MIWYEGTRPLPLGKTSEMAAYEKREKDLKAYSKMLVAIVESPNDESLLAKARDFLYDNFKFDGHPWDPNKPMSEAASRLSHTPLHSYRIELLAQRDALNHVFRVGVQVRCVTGGICYLGEIPAEDFLRIVTKDVERLIAVQKATS